MVVFESGKTRANRFEPKPGGLKAGRITSHWVDGLRI
jgi:hypothetical protein